MTTQADLEYADAGLFTRFYPNTKAGEALWREMAKDDGVAAVLSIHKKSTLNQIRAAGYTITKAKPTNLTMDDILKELGEL
ncbi:MAG: hypothetical protein KBC72_00490 [Acinetobacter sp.]|nr:hypothetical protein [Acinetobacter sp.]